MDESRLKFSDDKLEELTEVSTAVVIDLCQFAGKIISAQALFQDADTDGSGTISFDELKVELDKHPGVLENLTIRYSTSGLIDSLCCRYGHSKKYISF